MRIRAIHRRIAKGKLSVYKRITRTRRFQGLGVISTPWGTYESVPGAGRRSPQAVHRGLRSAVYWRVLRHVLQHVDAACQAAFSGPRPRS